MSMKKSKFLKLKRGHSQRGRSGHCLYNEPQTFAERGHFYHSQPSYAVSPYPSLAPFIFSLGNSCPISVQNLSFYLSAFLTTIMIWICIPDIIENKTVSPMCKLFFQKLEINASCNVVIVPTVFKASFLRCIVLRWFNWNEGPSLPGELTVVLNR